jgi:putative ABC transport system permease protein
MRIHALRSWPNIVLDVLIVVVLAVGLTTVAVLFLVVDRTLLRPLPYSDADRLVELQQKAFTPVYSKMEVARLADSPAFDSVEAYSRTSFTTSGSSGPKEVEGGMVTTGFFSMLGLVPSAGRLFDPQDGRNGQPVVVISHAYWRAALGADPAIVGQSIDVMGSRTPKVRAAIIGVLPEDVSYPIAETSLWLPVRIDPAAPDFQARSANLHPIARLKESVNLRQAQSLLPTARVVTLKSVAGGDSSLLLWAMFGFSGVVLAIAVANAANVQVARALTRRKEFATRTALGAPLRRIWGQLLRENLRLCGAAGGFALLLTHWSYSSVAGTLPITIARNRGLVLDSAVVGMIALFSIVLSIILTGGSGVFASRSKFAFHLGPSRSGYGRRAFLIQHALVAVSACLTVMLTAGAGLMLRTIWNLGSEDPGFASDGIVTVSVTPSIREAAPHHLIVEQLLEFVRSQSGVERTGAVYNLPLSGQNSSTDIRFESHPDLDPTDTQLVRFQLASDGYVRALGLRILKGRDLSQRDDDNAPKVALASEALARKYFPAGNAVGQRLVGGITIVGVVSDIRDIGLHLPPEPRIYFPYLQFAPRPMTLVIQTELPAATIAQMVRAELQRLDADGVVTRVRTIQAVVADSLGARSSLKNTLGFFSALSLLLSALGIYGTMRSWITNNTYEIGIRSAVGGGPGQILRWILRTGLASLTLGVGIGLAAARFSNPILAGSLYGIAPADVFNQLGVAIGCVSLGGMTIVLSALPVVRSNAAALLRNGR